MSLTERNDTAGPVSTPPSRDRTRPWLGLALATALAVIAALVVVLVWPDSDPAATPPPTSATPTTAAPTTAPPVTTAPPGTTAPAAPAPVDTSTAVFPSASGTRYSDPVAAARDFAIDFIGFTDPLVGPYRAGDARSGEVAVRADATGPVTTVLVRQLGTGGSWWVLGSTTDTVSVTAPGPGDVVTSPVTVQGAARAWEGTVAVEIRQDGARAAIGTGTVTGGGDTMRPFRGAIAFTTPTTPHGAVVFLTHSARDGRVVQATVVRVAFGS